MFKHLGDLCSPANHYFSSDEYMMLQNHAWMKDPKCKIGTSLVAQWLRIHLPMQGTWVRSLVQEDATCHGAAKPVHHNY